MAKRITRRMVIDASVARAAGPSGATFPTSKNCRDFLLAVRKFRHGMVMTPAIASEWRRHESRFARQWRLSMVAKKMIAPVQLQEDTPLRQQLSSGSYSAKRIRVMVKDAHLIEAAAATDRTVASLDDEARSSFAQAARDVALLRAIVWTNPDEPDESPIEWLANGARPEKRRQLGSYAPKPIGHD